MRTSFAVGLALVTACASAKTNPIVDAGPDPIDAAPGSPDAPDGTPDASTAGAITLVQNRALTITPNNTVACAGTYTGENSYYRVFPLPDFNITRPFDVAHVDFGVQVATAGSGTSQDVQVKLYTYGGTIGAPNLVLAQLTPLASVTTAVANGSGMTAQAPITATVPANANLAVEIYVPDGNAAQNVFLLGSNGAGETHVNRPGYIREPSAACNISTPKSFDSLGLGGVDLVITVTGTPKP